MVGNRKRGSLPSGGHKHLCAANLRTETGCPGVARGQERDRTGAGGDRRESGRGQLCRESRRPRVEMGRPLYPLSAPGHRGPQVLQPSCRCHPRGKHPVASSRKTTRRAAPRGRARDSRLCVHDPGRGAAPGDTPPQMPPRCPAGLATTPEMPGRDEQSLGCERGRAESQRRRRRTTYLELLDVQVRGSVHGVKLKEVERNRPSCSPNRSSLLVSS